MRFWVSFLRQDDLVLDGLRMAQVVALVVIGISILGFAYILRQPVGRRAAEVAAVSSPPLSEPPPRG